MTILQRDCEALQQFLDAHRKIVVLTGAGISVSSGIPAYRDREGIWQSRAPIHHQEFMQDAARRQHYWARSMSGWPAVRDAQPNAAHVALSTLERYDRVELLITQNVDRLHQRAGSRKVVDLHGRLDRVQCMACNTMHNREQIQQQLTRENKPLDGVTAGLRPDGDADVAEPCVRHIKIPGCHRCGGLLKPDVVFFGGHVPRERVQACMAAVERADALLAVGSSLQVYSGFRFCRHAAEMGKALALINPGKTRADSLAALKLHADCEPLLQRVANRF